MGLLLIIILSSLVFLASLLIIKTIFSAILITGIFSLLIFLIESYPHVKNSPAFQRFLNLSLVFLVSTLLSFSIYSLIYLPLEFRLTEALFKIEALPKSLPIVLLVSSALLFSFIDWSKILRKSKKMTVLLSVLLVGGIIFGQVIRREKLKREYLPKIYRLSTDWGIQGTLVEISGLNFGLTHKEGLVDFGGLVDFDTSLWSEKKVIGKLGVPKSFGKVNLRIRRNDNVVSNGVLFKVRDPGELK